MYWNYVSFALSHWYEVSFVCSNLIDILSSTCIVIMDIMTEHGMDFVPASQFKEFS